MVKTLQMWYNESTEEEKKYFTDCSIDDLYQYHNSVGRRIRNHFGLWNYSWEPELIDGVDYSKEHPDYISMQVIQEFWKQLKNIKQ